MPAEPANHEIRVLEEKFRALETLVRYERDLEKLKVYERELDLVTAELSRIASPQNSNVIPFPPKKPVRFAGGARCEH
jgi:hypothetical protein